MTRRALVCAPRMPEYDRECGSQRVYHFLRFLREDGWAVTFVASSAEEGERYAHELRQMGIVTYAGEDTRLAGDEYLGDLSELLQWGRFDLAILAFWHLGEKHTPALQAYSPDTRIVVDTIDLHFLRSARSVFSRPVKEGASRPALSAAQAQEFMRELNTYAAADAVLTVSDKEASLLRDLLAGSVPVLSVPLAEDLEASPVPCKERKGILFVGNHRHPPNAEAVQHLLAEILPRVDGDVLAQHPLYIVGNEMDRLELDPGLDEDSVRRVGWVPSLGPYLERARLTVVPLLHGAGTKGKLIQALTVGTPTVSTTVGTEGLDVHDGRDILVADDPASFARAIERLASDDALWLRLASDGRAAVTAVHGLPTVRARFRQVIDGVMQATPGRRKPALIDRREWCPPEDEERA